MKIRIKSTPPGEAPEHVRQAWVGLEMPIPPGFEGPRRAYGFGVLSGPKSWLIEMFMVLVGRAPRDFGYIVFSKVAIDLLATRSPEAASWWRQNVPRFAKPGQYFLFAAECCEELDDRA